MKILLMYTPRGEHLEALRAAAPGAEIVAAADERTAAALIEDADAVLGNRYFLQSLPRARRLRWMQSNSVGVDRILLSGADLGDLVITCSRGAYDDELSEHACALLLALARGLHTFRDQQRERAWERRPLARIAGMRALVLGWGGVGRAVSRRLVGLGMCVTGARRGPGCEDSGVRVLGAGTWRGALPFTDALVIALPLTHETRGLVGERELGALPPNALIVNVGRGGTLDESALLGALAAGRLAGAALDVLEEEPPAQDHPAWREPRLLLTPHVGRAPETGVGRWEPVFVENLRRFTHGEPLLHVVDREAGY